jgi:hypothetical protein
VALVAFSGRRFGLDEIFFSQTVSKHLKINLFHLRVQAASFEKPALVLHCVQLVSFTTG